MPPGHLGRVRHQQLGQPLHLIPQDFDSPDDVVWPAVP